ncbi:MAG: AraC family transcriptional regulator [Polyangiaceae bacterium]
MDPLSDVLSLLKVKTYWSGGFDYGGDWSFAFGPFDGIRFYAVISGNGWLAVDGVQEAVAVAPGDCVLLPRGRPFRVARDLAFEPADPTKTYDGRNDGGVTVLNGGGHFFGVGGEFALTGDQADVLLGVLPPLVHIRKEAHKAVLHWVIERMRQELREPQPGGVVVAQQLATLLLVQALRLHLAEEGRNGGVGWLVALSDKQMAAAIGAMHDNPGAPWTVQSLAARAGMSRTTFAVRFKERVGLSPLEYLTRWRMTVAGDRLVRSSAPISEIGEALGYDSQSAFSLAFKRVMGCSPGQYARGRPTVRAEVLSPVHTDA